MKVRAAGQPRCRIPEATVILDNARSVARPQCLRDEIDAALTRLPQQFMDPIQVLAGRIIRGPLFETEFAGSRLQPPQPRAGKAAAIAEEAASALPERRIASQYLERWMHVAKPQDERSDPRG